ncbi:ATP-binding protein [uncultured Parabacteroides sp.]|uniref:sensor histidine kinase n=1 Tax=uncultured Parabacteroides sp. TaxID=512312 RepID=UPI0025ED2057|nr:ATP-binding protein [uncultured Parabacteroides sp.]
MAIVSYDPMYFIQLASIFILVILIPFFLFEGRKFKYKVKDLKSVEEAVITRLLDSMSANFAFVDLDGTIRYVNQRVFKYLDVNRKGLVGKKVTDVLSIFHEQSDILPDILEELRQGTESIEFKTDTYLSEKDRDAIQLIEGAAFGIRDRNGQLLYILFFFRNVNKEKRQQYTMDMILNRTHIFPWTIEINTGVLTIDPRYFDYLGRPVDNNTITTEDFRAIIHPDDVDAVFESLTGQFNGASLDAYVSYRLMRGDGTWEWFEAQSTYMKSVSGSPFQLIGICMSTQKYKETEIRLQEALEKARQSEELKTAFLANMSHEIRTPLNAILGFSNLLTDEDVKMGSDEAREYSNIINQNGQHLLTLISDILDLSRIESNQMVFDMQSYSLNALLTDIYKTQSLRMTPEVGLVLQMPEYNTYLTTDSMRLTQVVNNLINNARKFTKEGSIRFGYRLEDDGRNVYIFVCDTGCGMEQKELSQIFDRFYKGSSHIPGTGLGLSICKTIVEKLNGNITVISEKGMGTEIILHFYLNE